MCVCVCVCTAYVYVLCLDMYCIGVCTVCKYVAPHAPPSLLLVQEMSKFRDLYIRERRDHELVKTKLVGHTLPLAR